MQCLENPNNLPTPLDWFQKLSLAMAMPWFGRWSWHHISTCGCQNDMGFEAQGPGMCWGPSHPEMDHLWAVVVGPDSILWKNNHCTNHSVS